MATEKDKGWVYFRIGIVAACRIEVLFKVVDDVYGYKENQEV